MDKIFKDIVEEKIKEARKIENQVLSKIKKKPASISFFKDESASVHLAKIEKRKSSNIHQLIPEEAIDTEAPSINTPDFYKANMKITLENEFMMLEILRTLTQIERDLLYFLVSREDIDPMDEELEEFYDIIKDGIATFRKPDIQDIYNNEWKFDTEFEISKKYVEQNRAWKK